MLQTIKEYIVLYAPTVFMAISSFLSWFKTKAQLRLNVEEIMKSAEIEKLSKEIKQLREQISCENHYYVKLIEQNEKLLRGDFQIIADGKELFHWRERFTRRNIVDISPAPAKVVTHFILGNALLDA